MTSPPRPEHLPAGTAIRCGRSPAHGEPERRMAGGLRPGPPQVRLAAMASSSGSNPEDEYADDQYADYDAEDCEQPAEPSEIPADEPEDDVLEQRQEVPYSDDDR
jgi:hypothetical protein